MVRTMRMVGLIVFLGMLFVPVARASDRTGMLIDRASAKYADLDFEVALRVLGQAVKEKGNTRAQLVRIYHLTGMCQGALQRYKEARKSFAKLLALDPTFRLGTDVSPRVRAPFDKLVRKNPKRLKVRALPPPFAVVGKPLVVTFQVDSDQARLCKRLRIWFRRGSAGAYSSIHTPLRGEGEHRVSIPAPTWEGQKKSGPLSWYAAAEGEHRSSLQKFGDALHPYTLEVTDRESVPAAVAESAWYEKWWVWALVGGVAAAATTTVVLLAATEPPKGPFDFTVDFSTSQ